MIQVKCCPIETTLKYIGKKWAINLIRDMMFGKKKFSDFLAANPELSTKVLSERLKDLEEHKIVEKKIVSTTPLEINYLLTEKGLALKPILKEMAKFSMRECNCEVFKNKVPVQKAVAMVDQTFK